MEEPETRAPGPQKHPPASEQLEHPPKTPKTPKALHTSLEHKALPSLLRSHRQIQYRSIGTTLKTASPPLCSLFSHPSRRRLVQELIVNLDSSRRCKASSTFASSRPSWSLVRASDPLTLSRYFLTYHQLPAFFPPPAFSVLIIPKSNNNVVTATATVTFLDP